ncbi:MaoC/PaaZ C-terminal domain-containing protein [Streptomyces sp. NPDC052179]|uniref:MaoC/PaaZ C-terminal domain-containing protein n=1 Tax=Streptomyces sp. NPDC052179 TaxID=3155680 RepID=UPI0034363406
MKRADGRGARVGDALAPLEIPVTRTLIVAGAVASRDYQDVHHDAELAREKGSPDIFMNILTTNGLVGRYITDHFGPSAVLRGVAIRLGAPNYPGDTMVLTGTVTALTPGPVPVAEVAVVGTNGLGRHVAGTVTVALPPVPEAPVPEAPVAIGPATSDASVHPLSDASAPDARPEVTG